MDIKVDGQEVEVALWDTAGQEDYDRLRALAYPDTSAFCICFAISSPQSLENATIKWINEIRSHNNENASIFLLGLQEDLRDDAPTIGELLKRSQRPVSSKQAERARRQINAHAYFECSAKTGYGIEKAFEAIVGTALLGKKAVATVEKKEERR
ncbi:MAG: hypothetical protein Q9207_007680, partial [Kuettlingeria erythrocarpa]